MSRLSLHFALGTAVLLISPLAMALGFGQSRTQTTLGQHLNFAASVILDADETVPRDCVTAEVRAGDYPVAPRNVRAVLEATRDPTQRIVRVTTSIAIDEPVVTIEVSIGCGSRITRRFVAFIDPPSLQLAEAGASESIALPAQNLDSQTVSLADIARQADASRRGGSADASSETQRPQRSARRTARVPATVVASANPTPQARPRRQAATNRPSSARSRTALAAAPRVAGARLRLDPPRAVAALPAPAPPAVVASPAAATLVASAPAVATAPNPIVVPIGATDPLLAQIAAAAAAVAGASAPVSSAEQERIQSLEAAVTRMRSESQATQQTVAALQARVRQAEESRYRNWIVYALVGTTLLGILVAAALWWLRPRQRRRARWFDAQANIQARAARAGPASSAGLASQPVPLSRPIALTPAVSRPASAPAPSRFEQSSGWSTAPAGMTTQQASIGGLEVTTVLGPELSRPSIEPFTGGGVSARQGGELTMEELIDLEQQAEFFVVLGQDEAAMSLLESYMHGTGGMSPLPYLQLLEIHQRRGDRPAYDKVRQTFNERFNANAPDWSSDLHLGRSLDDYPQIVARLQSLWATPLSAMQALDNLLFRRQEAEETFDFPAYRELLFLYSIAREISGNVETDFGSIDLFLPLEDASAEPTPSQSGKLEVDLDVSQWPEDAAMSDLLIVKTRPAGRRGG